jgi:membrane protease YdiL (CAAX protease family)
MFRKHFWQGTLWGFAASFLMVILLRLLGAASFDGLALHGQTFVKFALLWAAAFLLLGCAEEFAYRGYSQATLMSGMGFWPAAVLLSAIFGAVHYFFKPMENWMDGLSVGLFGLFWCFTLRRTGTLWFAIGFHAMSDYSDMVLFAQPNTGNNGQSLTGHLLDVSYRGPEWLTGGPRGTEASALEFLILAFLFFAFARVYPSITVRSDVIA